MTDAVLDEGVLTHAREGMWSTITRGLRLTPQLRVGLGRTLLLALVATAGRMVIPVAVQQTLDRGFRADGSVDLAVVRLAVAGAAVAVVVTGVAGYLTTARLVRTTEDALSDTRVRTFRHIHDLSMLNQATERRGALVSRVTGDVDTISQFMQWGGILLIISVGQLLLATVLMLFYSPLLTGVVLLTFVPLVLLLRATNPRLADRYGLVRVRVGETLGAVSESVVGASVIRAYGVEARTGERVDAAIDRLRDAQARAAWLNTTMFSSGEVFAAVATAAVLAVGLATGVDGDLTRGRLVAFLFLVSLFVQPVQAATEILNEAQTAVAGWRRVLDVLDTVPDVADPARSGSAVELPRGPLDVRFDHVGFHYPGGPPVLHDVDLAIPAQTRVAVVGETGSGKTTFAKLLTRLMDPTTGDVLLGGVRVRDVAFASLRRRVVVVPQDGFLFDMSIAENVRHGWPGASDDALVLAFTELGLAEWLDSLPHGLATRVGERGESLSAGERQLVALARAYVANPDLLVLDEATSAVDPATEVRLGRALEGITRGRTTVTIAHRLSTAEVADEVVVFEAGRVVQRGPHSELVAVPGRYATLHASWSAQSRTWPPPPPARRPRPPRPPPRPALASNACSGPALDANAGGGRAVWETGRVTQNARTSDLDATIAARLKRDAAGLFPAVAQQHDTGEVLMVGWMDDEALHRTLTTGRCTYWSRSRQEYWVKGETSGHQQWVRSVALDCDGDTVLVRVDQVGAACHTGDRTCFDADALDAVVGSPTA